MHQLINRFMHIGQGRMALLLLERGIHLRLPSFGKFFEGADIQISIVKPSFEFGHVLDQKTPVLADGVAAHGRHTFRNIQVHKCNELLLHLRFIESGGFDFVDQPAFARLCPVRDGREQSTRRRV